MSRSRVVIPQSDDRHIIETYRKYTIRVGDLPKTHDIIAYVSAFREWVKSAESAKASARCLLEIGESDDRIGYFEDVAAGRERQARDAIAYLRLIIPSVDSRIRPYGTGWVECNRESKRLWIGR